MAAFFYYIIYFKTSQAFKLPKCLCQLQYIVKKSKYRLLIPRLVLTS